LKDFYIPEITSITHDGEVVEAPKSVSWYPDQLAWYMTTPKHVIRRFAPFASFQKFLVAETDVGNISRQEVVSMIPPLCMDVQPGMTVLDLCAAPGSKSAQLIEMVHGGEEDRSRTVAQHLANGLDRPSGEEYEDEGRSTGLLIANDVDYKRAHMLVHQMKRLSSSNIIVTNHDATVYPSIKLPAGQSTDGKPVQNKYLKFDRILADVPCSGDGTCRKNLEIWKSWSPGNALGLHATQVRILVRALQMLKVGGRVVYSTCSMNPIEDEAVLAAAIDRCGGSNRVEIVDSSSLLPELNRYAGMKTWNVMDKQDRIWSSYDEVIRQREDEGIDGLARLQESMFPPNEDIHLERCMRVYPHLQDTGAFFIAILEKKSEIKAKTEEKPNGAQAPPEKVETADNMEKVMKLEVNGTGRIVGSTSDSPSHAAAQLENGAATKRKRDDNDTDEVSAKRSKSIETQNNEDDPLMPGDEAAQSSIMKPHTDLLDNVADSVENLVWKEPVQEPPLPTAATGEGEKVDEISLPTGAIGGGEKADRISLPIEATGEGGKADGISLLTAATGEGEKAGGISLAKTYTIKKGGAQAFEEPYKYLDPNLEQLEAIRTFYNISPRFPRDRFMVRNATGVATKNIYYTTALAKSILQENEGKGMKFVHCGVKMFVKQDVPNPDVCPWRIQTDGLTILEPWVGPQRRVRLWKRATLRKLLIEMFPRFNGDEWKKLGEIWEQLKEISMGCCVLQIEPSEEEDGFR
jgi:multisite-specific tRNA:(cytosine-C5)-methyltransferase